MAAAPLPTGGLRGTIAQAAPTGDGLWADADDLVDAVAEGWWPEMLGTELMLSLIHI